MTMFAQRSRAGRTCIVLTCDFVQVQNEKGNHLKIEQRFSTAIQQQRRSLPHLFLSYLSSVITLRLTHTSPEHPRTPGYSRRPHSSCSTTQIFVSCLVVSADPASLRKVCR